MNWYNWVAHVVLVEGEVLLWLVALNPDQPENYADMWLDAAIAEEGVREVALFTAPRPLKTGKLLGRRTK